MRLHLLIDEDTQDARLVSLLRAAGHDVLTVNAAGLTGQPDTVVLAQAARDRRVVLTMNCRDFLELHDAGISHPGIVGIYKGSDPRKNMTFVEIVASLANLSASGWDFAGQFVVLNSWNY